MNRKNILIANYHRPYPPRDGADSRSLDLIRAFKMLGYNVTLFSSDLFQQSPWNDETVELVERELGIKVIIYYAGNREKETIAGKNLQWNEYVIPGLKKYFDLLYQATRPDLVLVNYVFWADLAIGSLYRNSICIIDAIDMLSLNQMMAKITLEYLYNGEVSEKDQFILEGVNERLLKEDFFSHFNLHADKNEFDKYDQFDITIAINSSEQKLISENTSSTNSIYLPFSFTVNDKGNTYSEPPVFAIGRNQFNYQGYLYFAKKVLPVILKSAPDFILNVVGDGCRHLQSTTGINLQGFVPDLNEMYANCKFAICPLIGATGQQLKVMEAMANGLPVIVLRNVAERCPVVHNVNGLVADNAQEFAEFTLLLHSDPDLCRKLGRAARKMIEEEFTENKLLSVLVRAIEDSKKTKSQTRVKLDKLQGVILFKSMNIIRKVGLRLEQYNYTMKLKGTAKSIIKKLLFR